MKVALVSDLHLEWGYQPLPGGDVLILAGDICESRSLSKDFKSTKAPANERVAGYYKFEDFFWIECAKYSKVFYVIGNHEHYHGRYNKTHGELKSMLPPNVTLLEDGFEEYNGVVFMGSTLWTDLNKGDPVTAWHLKTAMNDYRVVENFYPKMNLYYKLTPDHTASVHAATKNYFESQLRANPDKPFVIITHHAPSFNSVHERFKADTTMNGGFCSDLSDLILDHSNIKYWVHGHTHDPVDYMIGDTHVISNPRGYLPYEGDNGFDVNFTFEV